jgi:hypothetical protein
VHIHYVGKWEGVGPWNSRVFWALLNGNEPIGGGLDIFLIFWHLRHFRAISFWKKQDPFSSLVILIRVNRVDEKVKFILQKSLIFRSSGAVRASECAELFWRKLFSFRLSIFSVCLSTFLFDCLLMSPDCRKFIYLSVRLSFICLRVSLYYFHSVCLSVFLSVCLSVCLFVYLNICLCLSICLSVCLSICLSVYLYICLSDCLSVLKSACQYFFLSVFSMFWGVCLFVCLSVFLSVLWLSVGLPVCISHLDCLTSDWWRWGTQKLEIQFISQIRRKPKRRNAPTIGISKWIHYSEYCMYVWWCRISWHEFISTQLTQHTHPTYPIRSVLIHLRSKPCFSNVETFDFKICLQIRAQCASSEPTFVNF